MGTILSTKLKGANDIIFEVIMPYEESIQLHGHMDDIHIFSENTTEMKTNISTRGKNGSTKYFLIPKDLRRNIDLNKEINCQKIDLKEKIIFIYSVDKF